MNKFKFSLDRSSKKFLCPSCSKRTFVKYIDNMSNNYLDSHIGRCDRESKCGYHKGPKGNLTLVDVSELSKPIITPSFHDDSVIKTYCNNYENNNFVKYLKTRFSKVQIEKLIKRYRLGSSNYWEGGTVFWQIDEFMRIKAGKIMLYNGVTGSRVKKPYSHITWMHKILEKKDFDSDCSQILTSNSKCNTNVIQNSSFVLQQCLFGLHLLHEDEDKIIAVVEAEKTALVMDILSPNYIWMATGSKAGFKEKMLKPLKNRKVIAFPDKSCFEDWEHKSKILNKEGFNIISSDFLERVDLCDGDDLVDFIYKDY
ncbi:DUF6371 domain-containing protein [Winogradskyella arenosi]|uniref:Toprim domain-containing protein n=1 Tax=Winogradskyella arenosi TaxID=533325 RepID=A0A368ZB63_9FLAO|nr:DUF6371 domain-containing protein [Winogradskyella arenosi]RCW90113.1 hypothetical protein DFQ08_1051 [Winogradskyella arenosi]